MTEEEKSRYRFSGYQLPTIELDETGKAYYQVGVHPYYKYQPIYWQQNAFSISTPAIGDSGHTSGSSSSSLPPTRATNLSGNKLCCMLSLGV